MKKVRMASLLVLMLALAACSSGGTSDSSDSSSSVSSSTSSEISSTQMSTSGSLDNVANVGFEDEKLTLKEFEIQITDHQIIQPGEKGNESGEEPVIAFWFDVKNDTQEKINPKGAWTSVFTAMQEDENGVDEKLEPGGVPDDAFLSTQSLPIDKGGTVSGAYTYVLVDDENPVVLTATRGALGDTLGDMSYEVK
ncbi:MAG: DUF5067 domain-containing protein [Enterococcus sp.]